MTAPEDVRNGILILLADEWDTCGPPGILEIADLSGQTGLAVEEVREALNSMFTGGIVDMDELRSAVYLTPEGYEKACRVRKW